MKKYRRPFASTGMAPKGHVQFKLDDSQGYLLLRRFSAHARKNLDGPKMIDRVAHAIDMFKRSSHPSKAKKVRPTSKAQKANATKIALRARGLATALEKADAETIKRLAQYQSLGESAEVRAAMRTVLASRMPEAMRELAAAADYGIARAERHQSRGLRGSPLQALVVDLARIWIDQTGQHFPASRESKNHLYRTKAEACRSFVEIVLYDFADLTKSHVSEKRLNWLMTNAGAIVSRDQDKTSSASSISGDDRDYEDKE